MVIDHSAKVLNIENELKQMTQICITKFCFIDVKKDKYF